MSAEDEGQLGEWPDGMPVTMPPIAESPPSDPGSGIGLDDSRRRSRSSRMAASSTPPRPPTATERALEGAVSLPGKSRAGRYLVNVLVAEAVILSGFLTGWGIAEILHRV